MLAAPVQSRLRREGGHSSDPATTCGMPSPCKRCPPTPAHLFHVSAQLQCSLAVSQLRFHRPPLQAAVTVARRVAQELDCPIGGEVGYAVRFEERRSPDTKITYVTGAAACSVATATPLTCLLTSHHRSTYGPGHARARTVAACRVDRPAPQRFVLCRWHAAAGVLGRPPAAQVLCCDPGRGPRAQPEHRHPLRRPEAPGQPQVMPHAGCRGLWVPRPAEGVPADQPSDRGARFLRLLESLGFSRADTSACMHSTLRLALLSICHPAAG